MIALAGQIAPNPIARTSFSEEILSVSWEELVPCSVGAEGETLRLSGYAEITSFLSSKPETLSQPSSGARFETFLDDRLKERFARRLLDCFVVEQGGRTVGVFVGQLWDWSSYYLRYLAMAPEHRGHGVALGVVSQLGGFLKQHGINRLEVEVSVSHRRQINRLLRDGFYPLGTLASERWGLVVRLAKFLTEPPEAVFLHQFSAGIRS